jgi:hypothetical protein
VTPPKMGSSSSKIPLKTISTNSILAHRTKSRNFVLSPRLCSSILRSVNGYCHKNDVKALRDFLAKPENSKFTLIKTKKRPKLDNEVVKFMEICQDQKKKPLSSAAEKHLHTILANLETSCNTPVIVSRIVMPRLEHLYACQVALKRQEQKSLFQTIRNIGHFVLSLFRFKLSPQILRKEPRGLKSASGLDRAHKLSLFLAVALWKQVYGHPFVNAGDKKLLREALAVNQNVYHTCRFTNRILHVKYDNEIVEMLENQNIHGQSLSSGAKMRRKQILAVLVKLKSHSGLMSDFCLKSHRALSKLS